MIDKIRDWLKIDWPKKYSLIKIIFTDKNYILYATYKNMTGKIIWLIKYVTDKICDW